MLDHGHSETPPDGVSPERGGSSPARRSSSFSRSRRFRRFIPGDDCFLFYTCTTAFALFCLTQALLQDFHEIDNLSGSRSLWSRSLGRHASDFHLNDSEDLVIVVV